jgi:hypothetical protein
MMRRALHLGCFGFILTLAGCALFGKREMPADPLFANRKPVESKPQAGPPIALPFSEPSPAPNPYAVGD